MVVNQLKNEINLLQTEIWTKSDHSLPVAAQLLYANEINSFIPSLDRILLIAHLLFNYFLALLIFYLVLTITIFFLVVSTMK